MIKHNNSRKILAIGFMIVLMAGIAYPVINPNLNSSHYSGAVNNDNVPLLPNAGAMQQIATYPAEGQVLNQQGTYNLTAGLLDAAAYNQAYTGGYLTVNQSGSTFSNTSLTPTGTFNATYSFTNDISGGPAAGFNYILGTGAVAQVVDSLAGHQKVLQTTTTAAVSALANNTFVSPQVRGTISTWFYTTDCSGDLIHRSFIFNDNGSTGNGTVCVYLRNSAVYYYSNLTDIATTVAIANNRWYYMTVAFDCVPGTFNVTLDGTQVVTNANFYAYAPLYTAHMFGAWDTATTCYFDAIDYSWNAGYYANRSAVDLGQLGTYNATETFDKFAPFTNLVNGIVTYPPQVTAPLGNTWGRVQSTTDRIYTTPAVATAATSHRNLLYTGAIGNPGNAWLFYGLGGSMVSSSVEFWANSGSIAHSGDLGYMCVYDQFIQYGGCSVDGEFDFLTHDLVLWNGGSMQTIMPYTTNTWYHIRYVINWGGKTFDAYVNNQLVASNFAFLNASATCINFLLLGTRSGTPGVAAENYWDAIDVSTDPAYSTERSSYMLLQQNATFSTQGSYSFRYALSSSGTDYLGSWTDFTVSGLPAPILGAITPNPSTTGIINLNWNAVAGATSYKVYRNTTQITSTFGQTIIGTPGLNAFTDNIFASGTYWYAVVSTNVTGDSLVSNSVSVIASVVPGAPALAAITPGTSNNGSIFLNWSSVSGALGYKVYRNSTQITDVTGWTPIATPTATNCTDLVTVSEIYWYAVVATNASGDSGLSNSVSVTVSLPPASPVLAAIIPNVSTSGVISLNWSAMPGAASYKVYRATSNITTVSGLTPIATCNVNWAQDLVTTNGTYWYAVVATNASGDSLPSNCVNVTVGIPPAIPQNGVMFTINVGVQVVVIRDANGNILFELSINVSVTVQMTVTVSTTNPSSTSLSGGLSYFKIDVQSGQYNQIVAKFHYDSSTLKPGEEDKLDALYLGTNGWEAQHGQVYKDSHYVLVNLAHFSTYAVAVVPTQTNTGNGGNQILLFVLLSVFVVLAILGIGAYLKMRKKNKNTNESGSDVKLDWDW